MTPDDRDTAADPVDPDDEPLLPVDEEIALITDYLARALTPDQRAEVERRLMDDEEFFDKVWPIIRIWQLPESRRRRRARAVARAAARTEAASVVAAAAPEIAPEIAQARAEADAPTTAPDGSVRPYADVSPPPRHVREPVPAYHVKKRSPWPRRTAIAAVAAALVVFVGWPIGTGLAYGFTVGDAQDLAKRDVQASRPAVGTYVETGHGETRTITLPGGSTVKLSPQSRFTYRTNPAWPHGVLATLKGEAQIEVSDADGMMFLGTLQGGAAFLPGNYAVRCELGCDRVKVTVGLIGTAWIKGKTHTQVTFWPLQSREHGEVGGYHDPQKTDGGPDYPVVP